MRIHDAMKEINKASKNSNINGIFIKGYYIRRGQTPTVEDGYTQEVVDIFNDLKKAYK